MLLSSVQKEITPTGITFVTVGGVTLKSLLCIVEKRRSYNHNISAPAERCNICKCNITASLCSALHNSFVRSKYEIQTSFCLSILYWISLAV